MNKETAPRPKIEPPKEKDPVMSKKEIYKWLKRHRKKHPLGRRGRIKH